MNFSSAKLQISPTILALRFIYIASSVQIFEKRAIFAEKRTKKPKKNYKKQYTKKTTKIEKNHKKQP